MSELTLPPGFGEAVVEFLVPGPAGPALVVYGFTDDGADGADVVAQAIFLLWEDEVMPVLTNTTFLQAVRVRINRAGTELQGEATGNVNGSEVAVAAPPNVSYLMRKRTGLSGRRLRGRMYWPGVVEEDVNPDGGVESARLTALNVAAAAMVAGHVTDGRDIVILHGAGVSAEPVPTPISEIVSDARVATQRRRLR